MSTPEQIGRHRILEPLGSGGFATVWRGYDADLEADVAVKILAENWANRADIRARFVDEARLLRRADSDRVVRVHDIGTLDDGRPYFVMSYADAGTLADRITGGTLPVAQALDLAEESARAVGVLHDIGVLHRDVKPSNILFRRTVDGERVMIADLGLAKAVANASGVTVAAGTPGYMPPEQVDGTGGMDERVDVYALGALTYQMLTGTLPASTGGETIPPSRLRSRLPAGTDAVVLRALERDRERRWPNAGAFAAALHDVAAGRDDTPPTVADTSSVRSSTQRPPTAAAPRTPRPSTPIPSTVVPSTPPPSTPVPSHSPYSHPPSPYFVPPPGRATRPARRKRSLRQRLVTLGIVVLAVVIPLGGCYAGAAYFSEHKVTMRSAKGEISVRVPNYWTQMFGAPTTRTTSLTRFGGTGNGVQLSPSDNADPDDLSDDASVTVVAGHGLSHASTAKLLAKHARLGHWIPANCQASGADTPTHNPTLPHGTLRTWTAGGCASSSWYAEAVLRGSGYTVLVFMKCGTDAYEGKQVFDDVANSVRVNGTSLPS